MKTVNQKGAVLAWVVILLTVVILVSGAALSVSFGYYSHVTAQSRIRQAELTARTVAEVIAASLGKEPDASNSTAVLLQEYPGTVIEVGGLDEAMGSCRAVSDYDEEGNLFVTVTAHTGETVRSVTAGFRPVGAVDVAGENMDEEPEEEYIRWELTELRAGEEHDGNP